MLYCIEVKPRLPLEILSSNQPTSAENPQMAHLSREVEHFFKVLPPNFSLENWPLFFLDFEKAVSPGGEMAQKFGKAAGQLLVDPVAEEISYGPALEVLENSRPRGQNIFNVITVFHPGVTDAVGESARIGFGVVSQPAENFPPVKKARTSQFFRLRFQQNEEVNPEKIADFVRTQLINPLIQDFVVYGEREFSREGLENFLSHLFSPPSPTGGYARKVPLKGAGEEELSRISREGLLALDLAEMKAIQHYFKGEGRDPSDIELETLAQTWSEHCIHKTFKAEINYSEFQTDGMAKPVEKINGLFKSFIVDPTEKLAKSWIKSAFSDNAGIIAFDRNYDLSFKVETHNHPSALEPFGGANTGLGGVIRDVMAVSAKPVASTDVFCFGPLNTPEDKIPAQVIPPEKVFRGVVSGVRDYGNKMGIPTVNGAVLFEPGYLANPLVFCGTVGFSPAGSHPRNVKTGDKIIVLGGRTGRDGVHGATFSSIELGGETSNGQLGSVVQIGNPIEEKKTLDLIIRARDKKLYSGITDCGAGGLSSAIGEMGQETGARVELDRVPLKYEGLEPWEIWVSEAQERMVLAVPPENLSSFYDLCQTEEVEATDLGEFTGDGLLTLNYSGKTIGILKMSFLHHGFPQKKMEANWRPASFNTLQEQEVQSSKEDLNQALLTILADPNVASKEAIIRLYDHEVQGGTVVKPLVGIKNDGPGDAAVIKPLLNSNRGVVISNGINPRYGLLDPYRMAACAIDEAVRNAVSVGASLDRLALLDNFCWGNPNNPERLGELVQATRACRDYALAFGLPFISGKDSLNNEYYDPFKGQRLAIPGTLLISLFGIMEDVSRAVTMDLKEKDNLIYLVGETYSELGGSYYHKQIKKEGGNVPRVNPKAALKTFKALALATKKGLVRSCHDLSEGGLAVAAAEMAFSGGLGLQLDLEKVQFGGSKNARTGAALLFSETPSRFLVEVEPENQKNFETSLKRIVYSNLGKVTEKPELVITGLGGEEIIRLENSRLKAAWQTPLSPE